MTGFKQSRRRSVIFRCFGWVTDFKLCEFQSFQRWRGWLCRRCRLSRAYRIDTRLPTRGGARGRYCPGAFRIPALMPIPTAGHWTNPAEHEGVKQGGDWFGAGESMSMSRRFSSKSDSRKAASAQIAKIPFPLARHIAQCFRNVTVERVE